jgi:hypothetical protein
VATVTERGKDGKIVLKAGEQLLRIEQPVDLPLGMRLQISAAANMPIAVLSADINFSDDRTGPLAKLIELLDGIDRAVRQPMTSGQPAPAGQLPAPGKHLASRFLGLLALGNAQPKQEQPSSPDQGGVAVTQRSQIQALIHDLGAMSSESAEEGWKSFTLPIGLDHNEAVCCYFRDHAPDPDHEEGEGEFDRRDDARRAVFDVSFSRLGRCQIDAFCRQQRFDLLIRSETALLQPVQDDIAMLFGSACEIAGMNGEIAFRIGGFFEPSRSPTIVKALET